MIFKFYEPNSVILVFDVTKVTSMHAFLFLTSCYIDCDRSCENAGVHNMIAMIKKIVSVVKSKRTFSTILIYLILVAATLRTISQLSEIPKIHLANEAVDIVMTKIFWKNI